MSYKYHLNEMLAPIQVHWVDWTLCPRSYPGLIADSTMPSNSTVLQQMYPDFVQVERGGSGMNFIKESGGKNSMKMEVAHDKRGLSV